MSRATVEGKYASLRGNRDIERLRPLREAGIPVEALTEPEPIVTAIVEFLPGRRFEFVDAGSDGAVRAYVVLARDEGGLPLDLVAFRRDVAFNREIVASWQGAAVLGENCDGIGGLPEFSTVKEWLLNNRRGVVRLDPDKAALCLQGRPIAAFDDGHAEALRTALCIHPTVIVSPDAYRPEARPWDE